VSDHAESGHLLGNMVFHTSVSVPAAAKISSIVYVPLLARRSAPLGFLDFCVRVLGTAEASCGLHRQLQVAAFKMHAVGHRLAVDGIEVVDTRDPLWGHEPPSRHWALAFFCHSELHALYHAWTHLEDFVALERVHIVVLTSMTCCNTCSCFLTAAKQAFIDRLVHLGHSGEVQLHFHALSPYDGLPGALLPIHATWWPRHESEREIAVAGRHVAAKIVVL